MYNTCCKKIRMPRKEQKALFYHDITEGHDMDRLSERAFFAQGSNRKNPHGKYRYSAAVKIIECQPLCWVSFTEQEYREVRRWLLNTKKELWSGKQHDLFLVHFLKHYT